MNKLIAIIALLQNVYGKWLYRRLLSGVIVIAALVIVTSLLMGAALVGGFYAAYQGLLHAGFSPAMSSLGVSALIAVMAGLLMFTTSVLLRRLHQLPHRILTEKMPQVSEIGDMVDGFIEGFLNPQPE